MCKVMCGAGRWESGRKVNIGVLPRVFNSQRGWKVLHAPAGPHAWFSVLWSRSVASFGLERREPAPPFLCFVSLSPLPSLLLPSSNRRARPNQLKSTDAEQQSPGFPAFRRFSNVRLRSVSLPAVPSSHSPRHPVDEIKPSTSSDH